VSGGGVEFAATAAWAQDMAECNTETDSQYRFGLSHDPLCLSRPLRTPVGHAKNTTGQTCAEGTGDASRVRLFPEQSFLE